ncbi:MAG TPA: metalloregulator ArsR/SmtB family transcription factor [Planctomycetota bacterium]|nr:metalloregulator ArsR/SmtB family transcription factor [Planctomycetota bacterium]
MPKKPTGKERVDPASQRALRKFKAEIFQVLGHPTRIHIIECLRDGELSVKDIQLRLGIESSNASQHLALLRASKLVTNRKAGNQVFYAIRDPLLIEALDVMRRYFHAHLEDAMGLLRDLREDA